MARFLVGIMAMFAVSGHLLAQTRSNNFDFLLVLTQQDIKLDWWKAVPIRFQPKASTIDSVSRGEYFKILPVFRQYGIDGKKAVNITYKLIIHGPDGSIYHQVPDCIAYQGLSAGPVLIPSGAMPVVCFDPNDPFGTYVITVAATDHVTGQRLEKSENIELKPFELPVVDEDVLNTLFHEYPTGPHPAKALAALLRMPHPCINSRGVVTWPVVWFYKRVFEDNEFLIPHAIKCFNEKTTLQQKKNLLLVFHLLGKDDLLPVNDELMKKCQKNIEQLNIPDPYSEIKAPEQLDMLWGEFFATARVKPIRQILSALDLFKNVGTLKKIKSGELNSTSSDVRQKAMLEVTFESAVWSIESNCKQCPLLFQYCTWIYDSGTLNGTIQAILGRILQKVSEDAKVPAAGGTGE